MEGGVEKLISQVELLKEQKNRILRNIETLKKKEKIKLQANHQEKSRLKSAEEKDKRILSCTLSAGTGRVESLQEIFNTASRAAIQLQVQARENVLDLEREERRRIDMVTEFEKGGLSSLRLLEETFFNDPSVDPEKTISMVETRIANAQEKNRNRMSQLSSTNLDAESVNTVLSETVETLQKQLTSYTHLLQSGNHHQTHADQTRFHFSGRFEHDARMTGGMEHDARMTGGMEHDARMIIGLDHDARMTRGMEHDSRIISGMEHDSRMTSGMEHDARITGGMEHDARMIETDRARRMGYEERMIERDGNRGMEREEEMIERDDGITGMDHGGRMTGVDGTRGMNRSRLMKHEENKEPMLY